MYIMRVCVGCQGNLFPPIKALVAYLESPSKH